MSIRFALLAALLGVVPTYAKAPSNGSIGQIPLFFETNHGQSDSRVKFLSRGAGYGIFLMEDKAVLRLTGQQNATVQVKLVGASSRPKVSGVDPVGESNHFNGTDPLHWQTQVPTYLRVHYAGVYPGIDLTYYGNQRRLEYDFRIQPGARPERIQLRFDGLKGIEIGSNGELVLRTSAGEIRQPKPVVYQEHDGRRIAVDGEYTLLDRRTVGFRVGFYDSSKPLTIDPVLVYSTYFGGSAADQLNAIAVDKAGNIYVTGQTSSTDIISSGSVQATNHGLADGFVVKLDAGMKPLYSTYFGGNGNDEGHAIAVDDAGNAYVTGYTSSADFPVTSTGIQKTKSATQDGYLIKLSPAGDSLLYATYLGGNGDDRGMGVALDSKGGIYVTGLTGSTNFPVTNPFQSTNGAGIDDVFVTKFGPSGSIQYSTYVGGLGHDQPYGITVDAAGSAYVAGITTSADAINNLKSERPFPLVSAFQGHFGGGSDDAFLFKLAPEGNSLVYSTFLGGSGTDIATRVAVNNDGMACVTGYTGSDVISTVPFPLQNALSSVLSGGYDAFVTCFAPDGQSLVFSTYYGGEGNDSGTGIGFDAAGRIYVAGYSESILLNNVNSLQASTGGARDGFVLGIDLSGPMILFASYLGGSNTDAIVNMAVDSAGTMYLAGLTASTNFPLANALQGQNNGSSDSFIAKIVTNDIVSNSAFSLNTSGGISLQTSGARDSAVFGYATADAIGAPINGLVILDSKASRGQTVSQVGITAPALSTSGRLFVEVTSTVRSVLSIANPSDDDANVDFFFTDASGNGDHFGSVTVAPHTHFSRFVTDDPLNIPTDSTGTISFTASIPVAATAFRTLTNERSDFLISSTPIADGDRPPEGKPSVIPRFEDGTNWNTQVILVNTSEEQMNGEVHFLSQGSALEPGSPIPVSVGGGAATVQEYDIPPRSFQRILTTGAPIRSEFPFATRNGFAFKSTGSATNQSTGFATLSATSDKTSLNGLAIVEAQQNGTTVSETGLVAEPPLQKGAFFVEVTDQIRTVLHFVNAGDLDASVDLSFTDESGNAQAPVTVTVPAHAQLNQAIGDDPLVIATNSAGTIMFNASSPVAISVVQSRINERSENLTSVTPVVDATKTTSDPALVPYVADGAGWTSSVVLVNTSDQSMAGEVRFIDQGSAALPGQPLVLPIGDGSSVASAVQYNVPPRSSQRIQTAGTGLRSDLPFTGNSFVFGTAGVAASQSAGSAVAKVTTPGKSINGLKIIEHLESGLTTSEAGLVPAPLFRSGRFFVQVTSAVKSFVSIVNPTDGDATVDLYFTDEAGVSNYFNTVTVAPHGQFSGFVNDAPLSIPTDSSGTLTFTASVRVAAGAFRFVTNEGGRLLISATPISDATQVSSQPTVIPYFTDGANWSTQVVLVNTSEFRMGGEVRFFGQNGAAVEVPIGTGDTSASVLEYDIPPRSSQRIQTAGTSTAFTAGSIQIVPHGGNSTPHGHAILSRHDSGNTAFETPIESETPASTFRLYAEATGDFDGAQRESRDTLLAIANPSPTAATFRLTLAAIDGSSLGNSDSITVPANGTVSLLLRHIPGLNLPSSFRAVAQLTTLTGRVAVVGMRETVSFEQQLRVTTTGPFKDNAIAPAQFVFPYVTDGNGFKSQTILVSETAGDSLTGVLGFVAPDGSPMIVDELRVGSVRIVPIAGNSAPHAHVALHRSVAGITLFETTVDLRAAASSLTLYAEVSGDFQAHSSGSTQTVVAIANPSGVPAIAEISLTTLAGTATGAPVRVTIPANGQVLFLLNELPGFQTVASFQGFLRVAGVSGAKLAAVGLRALYNSRADLLATTTGPLHDEASTAGSLVLPYVTDGGGFTTQVVLTGGSSELISAGVLRFFGTDGSPLNMDELRTGSIQIIPVQGTLPPHAHAVLSHTSNAITLFQTAIAAQQPSSALRLYAEGSGNFDAAESLSARTWIAVANPSSSTVPVRFELQLFDGRTVTASAPVNIPANGQIATSVNAIPGFETLPASFQGMLTARAGSASGITAASFLAVNNEGGEMIVTTTGPLDENATSSRLIFPHIAEGGGYTTKFIVVNGTPNQKASGVVQFITQQGTPLGVTLKNQ